MQILYQVFNYSQLFIFQKYLHHSIFKRNSILNLYFIILASFHYLLSFVNLNFDQTRFFSQAGSDQLINLFLKVYFLEAPSLLKNLIFLSKKVLFHLKDFQFFHTIKIQIA